MSDNILHTPALYRYLVLTASEKMAVIVGQDTALEMAKDIAASFCKQYEGEWVRVPNLARVEKIARDNLIREQAETMTIEEIAAAHNLNEKTVLRAIAGE